MKKYYAILLLILTSLQSFAAPGDILYQNTFSDNGDVNGDWDRTSGNGNDFQANTSTFSSSPRSLRIRDGSGGISDGDLIDAAVPSAEVSFWLRQGSPSNAPESGEDLEFYYMDSGGSWVLLSTYLGADASGTVYNVTIALPAGALHDDLRFQFNMTSGGNTDRWYVDDFTVTETGVVVPPPVVACLDVFSSGTQTTPPGLTLPTFLYNSSDTELSGDSLSVAAGEYEQIEVDEDGTVNFTTIGGVYRIDELELDENAVATFAPGDYFINELDLEDGAEIIVAGPGTVRIFVNEASIGSNVSIGVGTPYIIFVVYDELEIDEDFNFEGVLYSTDSVEIDEDSNITGAIHADSIDLGDDVTVTYSTSLITGADFNGMCGGSPDIEPTLVAHYEMEEAFWGSVIDSESGFNGTAFNGANTVGTSCRYGQFDGVDDYVQIPHQAALNGSNALTYVAYIRPDSWTGIDQIMAKSVHGGGSGRAQMGLFSEGGVFKGRAETVNGRREIQAPLPTIAGEWVQVALVFSATSLTLYQDGLPVATTSFSSTTLVQTTDPLNISKRVGTDTYYFHGLIDDVRIYTSALTDQDILDLYNTVTPCSLVAIDHILISHDNSALTCSDETITLTACANADCSIVATSDVSVTLSTTGVGTSVWSENPVIIPANSSLGVTVSLTHRTAETITLSAVSIPASTNPTVCSPAGCDITFSDTGFLLSLADHNSCSTASLNIQAVQLSETGNSCAPAYSGNQSVDFSFNYANPITGTRVPDLDSANMAAATVVQNRTINFDVTASATLDFAYQDAGQLTITVADGGTNGLASANVNTTVTPDKLMIATSDANNACSGNFGSCSVFRVAGTVGNAASEFNLVISGACADDSVTPNFALDSIALTSNLVAPSGGSNASLGITSVDINSAGSVVVNQTLSDVGAYTITATAPLYFGQTIPAATSSTIGRFVPDRFSVTVDAPTDTPFFVDASCGFTYQDQEFGFGVSENPVITITALNSAGAVTRNYGGAGVANNDFWKLDASALSSRRYLNQIAAFPGSLNFSLVSSSIATLDAADYDGVSRFSIEGDLLTYSKSAAIPVATADANFDAQVTLNFTAESLTDADGVFYDADNNNLRDDAIDDFDVTNIGSTNIRWGRWFIDNAFGSELQPQIVTAQAQYFDGTNFVLNTDDNCSSTITSINPLLSNYSGDLTSGETTMTVGSMVSGLLPITLTAPGNGNDGSLIITLPEPGWMMYDYDGDGSSDDATAQVTFGIFQGKPPVIIWRQVY